MSGEIRAGIALVLVGAAMFMGGLVIGQPFLGLGVVVAVIGMLVTALDLVRSDSGQAAPVPPYLPPPPYQAAPPPPPTGGAWSAGPPSQPPPPPPY